MENIDKITEMFKDEKDIIIVCSQKLALKLNKELSGMNVSDIQQGMFKNKNMTDLGFTSVYRNGVQLHYTSDFERVSSLLKT